MLPTEGSSQGHGCCWSLVWEERLNPISGSSVKRWYLSHVDHEIWTVWRSPSTGMAVMGCRDPQQGSLVGKRSYVKLLGQVRQYWVRPEPCISARGPIPAAWWPVALVQGVWTEEACSLWSVTGALCLLLLPMLQSHLLERTSQAFNMGSWLLIYNLGKDGQGDKVN